MSVLLVPRVTLDLQGSLDLKPDQKLKGLDSSSPARDRSTVDGSSTSRN